jgi:hypothetical protein
MGPGSASLGRDDEIDSIFQIANSEIVIARSKATKQSILSLRGEMDCFAEPVVGRAFARYPLARNDGLPKCKTRLRDLAARIARGVQEASAQ